MVCDGEGLYSPREFAWFPGAKQRVCRHVPRIVFGVSSMTRMSLGALRSRGHVVPAPFVVGREGWQAAPAPARRAAQSLIPLFHRALLPPYLQPLEMALYQAFVPRLDSMPHPVSVKIYPEFHDFVEDSMVCS